MHRSPNPCRQGVARQSQRPSTPIFYFLNQTDIILARQTKSSPYDNFSPDLRGCTENNFRPIRLLHRPSQSLPRRSPTSQFENRIRRSQIESNLPLPLCPVLKQNHLPDSTSPRRKDHPQRRIFQNHRLLCPCPIHRSWRQCLLGS